LIGVEGEDDNKWFLGCDVLKVKEGGFRWM